MIENSFPEFVKSGYKTGMQKRLGHETKYGQDDFLEFNKFMRGEKNKADFAYKIGLQDSGFVKIQNGIDYYGGDQNWLKKSNLENALDDLLNIDDARNNINAEFANNSKKLLLKPENFYTQRACGAVAAANILAYYANSNQYFKDLYFGKEQTQIKSVQDFILHMTCVLSFVEPKFYGMPTVGMWIRGVESALKAYSNKRIFKIHKLKMTKWMFSSEKARAQSEAFIQYNLLKNRPVACLHLGFPQRKLVDYKKNASSMRFDLSYHWVTINEIMQSEDGKAFVIVSTWGKKCMFLLEDFLDGFPSFVALDIK